MSNKKKTPLNTSKTLLSPKSQSSSVKMETVEGYEDTDDYEYSLEAALSRTSLILLDYKQFKSAQKIQALWRGFFYRKDAERRRQAAITIQRWWRGFYVRKNWYKWIENKLQQAIIDRFNEAATLIQASYRGWYVRKTVHDASSLRRIQHCAAEDLLHCVAFKLHHLLRTCSIPGVYSLRNSKCLSRVEKLMANMRFRFHNDSVYASMALRTAQTKQQEGVFEKSKYFTSVPYDGPNFQGVCKPNCMQALLSSKDMDQRMYKIIAMYEESQKEEKLKYLSLTLTERKRRQRLQKVLDSLEKNKRDFCGDVIESMRKWEFLTDKSVINKDIFKTPENLEKFLADIQDILDELNKVSCHCKMPVITEPYCH